MTSGLTPVKALHRTLSHGMTVHGDAPRSERPRPPATCSGIVITAAPGRLDDVRRELERLPGILVHAADPATGRLVITQEAPDTTAQMDGLRRLQRLPGILTADLVYHLCEPPAGDGSQEREEGR